MKGCGELLYNNELYSQKCDGVELCTGDYRLCEKCKRILRAYNTSYTHEEIKK